MSPRRDQRLTDEPPWWFDIWLYAAFGVLVVVMLLMRYFNPRPF